MQKLFSTAVKLVPAFIVEITAAGTEPNLAVMVSGSLHKSLTYNYDTSGGMPCGKFSFKILNTKGFQLSFKLLRNKNKYIKNNQ